MEKISTELKAAIIALSSEEKDKLLLRLLRLKPDLINKLTYELIEEKETLDSRTSKIQKEIDQTLSYVVYHFSPGVLLMSMRACNGTIAEHVKITKDKMGEVFLTLHYLLKSFDTYNSKLNEFERSRSLTFSEYVVKRTVMIIEKAQKLDALFQDDITEQINRLLDYVHGYQHTGTIAAGANLPKFYVFGDVAKRKK